MTHHCLDCGHTWGTPAAPQPPQAPQTPPPAPLSHTTVTDDQTPADWLRNHWDWHTELTNAGWTISRHTGQDTYWTRPGKPTRDGHSAILHGPDGPLVVWTTSAPELAALGRPTVDGSGYTITPLQFVAATQHGGDLTAATRTIRHQMPAPTRPTAGAADRLHTPPPPPNVDPETGEILEQPDGDNPEETDEAPTPLDTLRKHLYTTRQLANIPPPNPIINGWLNRDSLAMLYGPSGSGKSFAAVDIANTIASTRTWWHSNPVTNGPTLYVVAEGLAGMQSRAHAWETHHNTPANTLWLAHATNIYEPVWADALAELAAEHTPNLIVVDTMARTTVGADENSARDAATIIDNLDRIRRHTGACVLVVHHTGKDTTNGARGSSAFRAAVDTEIEVTGGVTAMTLKVTKQKYAAEPEPLSMHLKAVDDSGVLVGGHEQISPGSGAALEALAEIELPGGMTNSQWQESAGMAERTFMRHVKHLLERGLVVNVGTDKRPRYRTAASFDEVV